MPVNSTMKVGAEMSLVRLVRHALYTCGTKAEVVRVAAMNPRSVSPDNEYPALALGLVAREQLHRVAGEHRFLVRGFEVQRVDVALGVVEVVARLRVDAAHRSHHLRGEEDVLVWDHLEQQV